IDPAWPVIRLLQKVRLAEILTKADEGWENHRRRLPEQTVLRPAAGMATADANSSMKKSA
nr:hypothetical protein [Rubrobacteraceae bacterium]